MNTSIIEHLSRDRKLRMVVENTEIDPLSSDGDLYAGLLRAVVYQQLSGRAANAIYRRFLDLFPDNYPQPDLLLKFDLPELRAAGLSRQKAGYIQNIASFFTRECLLDREDWSDYSDEELIRYLVGIKGVGRWTVQMILMFTLRRPDILPADDLGIQQAMSRLYQIEQSGRALKKQMLEIAEAWRPYRSYACRYLWKWHGG